MRNRLSIVGNIIIVVVVFFLSVVGCGVRKQEQKPMRSMVMRELGWPLCSTDDSKTWKILQLSSMVDPNSLLKTLNVDDFCMSIGETNRPEIPPGAYNGSVYNPEIHPSNLVRVHHNSTLEIERAIEVVEISGKRKEEIVLALFRGSITGSVKDGYGTYDVKLTNGTIRMEPNTIYKLMSSGRLEVLKGRASVKRIDGASFVVSQLHSTDLNTGEITELPPLRERWEHDLWLPSDPGFVPWAVDSR